MIQILGRLKMNVLILVGIIVCAAVNTVAAQMIVAHRGASKDAPENTIAAFELAWKQKADVIEGDFYLSSDGRIVTIHDRTTKRTAGVDLPVAKTPFDKLRRLDVGAWKAGKYRGERIPTLAEVLATIPKNKKIFIEIKSGPEIVAKMIPVLEASGLDREQTAVIAFDKEVVAKTKQLIPEIKVYWLTSFKKDKVTGEWSPKIDEILKTLKELGADGLDANGNRDVIDEAFVKALRDNGMGFHVWTIDEPSDVRYFQRLGVDSITTNRPDYIRREL